jgi:hypothetical protein
VIVAAAVLVVRDDDHRILPELAVADELELLRDEVLSLADAVRRRLVRLLGGIDDAEVRIEIGHVGQVTGRNIGRELCDRRQVLGEERPQVRRRRQIRIVVHPRDAVVVHQVEQRAGDR